jgi:hypothetical protein
VSSNVTREELRNRIRFEADMVNSSRATDADINALINTHLSEFYGRLVEAGPPDYFSTDYAFSSVAGTISYALPSNFRTLVALYFVDGTRKREVYQMREGTIAQYDAPQGNVSLVLRYIAAPPKLTTDTDPVTGTIDGVSGWDELIVQLCARALLRRDRRDTSALDLSVAEKRAEMLSQARARSVAGPRYITDVDAESGGWWGCTDSVDAWVLRAGYLDLYSGNLVPW